MQEEQARFWLSIPRLKIFLNWLTIGTCAFFVIDTFPLIGFSSNVILLIIFSGTFLLIGVWSLVAILLTVVGVRWSMRQRHPRKPGKWLMAEFGESRIDEIFDGHGFLYSRDAPGKKTGSTIAQIRKILYNICTYFCKKNPFSRKEAHLVAIGREPTFH